MKKVAVVFWSGTGNTEEMANAVNEGAQGTLINIADFTPDMVDSYDALAFGCPAMGDEVLEDSEFEPGFTPCLSKLSGKKIGLFGSYGWGDGEWMRNWETTCRDAGAVLVADGVICNEAPDDEAVEACKALGASLAE